MSDYSLDFPFAHGEPLGSASFRSVPEDFVVDESLGFEPQGNGEHLLLHIQKRNQNTRWVAEQLAQIADIKAMDVGYCGMKDRRAVTSQWFSLYLPKKELNLQAVEALEGVTLLASGRHPKKLRRGDHQSNHFIIRLRELTADHSLLEQRLAFIAEQGVPNYFGEQRFGHDAGNLREFEQKFVGQSGDARSRNRQRGRRGGRSSGGGQSGIYLSAGRSYLFNRILATRMKQHSWNKPLEGEELPTGAMWGRGRHQGSEARVALEQQVADSLPGWGDALEHSGLSQERRDLVLHPQNLQWQFESNDLVLSFGLLPGCFATSVLRELTELNTAHSGRDIVGHLDNHNN
ncbi:tRNA pseudouridine(13) synthase TruD [Porticoccaceae bacterium LTM1]|nr:tRNA pseudouridine(13) synthase TruD [Porticoccaceae bacterium LTM1]